jgi:hypothetical protein
VAAAAPDDPGAALGWRSTRGAVPQWIQPIVRNQPTSQWVYALRALAGDLMSPLTPLEEIGSEFAREVMWHPALAVWRGNVLVVTTARRSPGTGRRLNPWRSGTSGTRSPRFAVRGRATRPPRFAVRGRPASLACQRIRGLSQPGARHQIGLS